MRQAHRAATARGLRIPRIGAVLVTVVAAALAATAQSGAHAATSASTGSTAGVAPARTTLHVHVAGCDHCQIQLQHAVTTSQKVWTSKQRKVGSDHEAVFHVLTANTHGLSFIVYAPWAGNIDANTNFVTRDSGQAVGSLVTRSQAHAAKHAEGCWAGTSDSEATLKFRVVRVPSLDLMGHRTHIALGFAPHGLASWKPMEKTFHGTLGNQDAFYCTPPKA